MLRFEIVTLIEGADPKAVNIAGGVGLGKHTNGATTTAVAGRRGDIARAGAEVVRDIAITTGTAVNRYEEITNDEEVEAGPGQN